MAFRFRREGDFIKNRVHLERMGMQPWIEDFKWRVASWHYEFYMKEKAQTAIRSNQRFAPKLQQMMDERVQRHPKYANAKPGTVGLQTTKRILGMRSPSSSSSFSPHEAQCFTWRNAVPNIVPYRKSSNPFCPVTPNHTGWKEVVERKIPDPKPKGHKHVVSGTDDTVPVMPRFR